MKINFMLTTILVVLTGYISKAQIKPNYHFEIESGVGISIGPTTYKYYTPLVNPSYTLQQYGSRRYRLPTAIIHGTVWKQLAKPLKIGLTSGINIHYFEINSYGNYHNALTIPVQLAGNLILLKINDKLFLESELKCGYNFQRQNFPPKNEKGGCLSSLTIVLMSMGRSSHFFLLKLGYELQLDRDIFTISPYNLNDQRDKISNTVKRKSLCLTFAVPL